MRSGIRDFGVTLGGHTGRICIGLLTQSILAWTLGPADRGSLAICLVYSSILFIVFAVSCDISAVYFVSSGRFSLSEGIIYTLIYGISASLAAIVIGWYLIALPLAFFNQASRANFRLSLFFIPVLLLAYVLPRLLTAIHQFKLYSMLAILRSVFQLIFTVLFVLILKWGVKGALMASIINGAAIVLIVLVIFRWKFDLRLVKPTGKKFLSMFIFGLRYYPGKLSNQLNLEIAPIMLAFFATRTEIGWFAIAARLTQLVEMIPETMTTVLFPRVAGDREGRSRLVARAARVIGIICGLILILLAVLADPIVTVFFSPAFLPAVPFIRILALGLIVRCMCKVLVPYLIGIDHPGHASFAVIAGVTTNLGLIWLLLPRIGVIGAPWGMTASYFVSSAVLLASFSHYSGLSVRQIFSYSRADWIELEKMVSRGWRKIFAP
jgi:O-antigen/teichoic acid export membrane protein